MQAMWISQVLGRPGQRQVLHEMRGNSAGDMEQDRQPERKRITAKRQDIIFL